MTAGDDFEAMAQACIANYEKILRYGPPEMQTASRMLLYALVEEIHRREQAMAAVNDDEN
ncbi:hypothetical protein SAMN02799625_05923 [Methylobacterium sp. UNC300MFChir4.1]|uniref:hypothetical protein n=1 Tax=unclassified Methylobacterium TaxID=2615210 RepID=UPI0008B3C07A|nr:hypothetical protein [Methylobacterium sp. UNC300MFChir4.1]SEP39669.1 hypothetical protein SAMN02799625_05923 [Methylobacterium sp. UNC300MFChir4.1]